jgi:uncharacterized protein (DUF1499 family)
MSAASLARLLPRIFAAIAALNVLAIIGALAGRLTLGWEPFSVFKVYFFGARAGLYIAALGLLTLIAVLIMKQQGQWKYALLIVVLGILPLGTGVAVVGPKRFTGSPMIHDISTDTSDPPDFISARELRKPGENTLDYGGEKIAESQHAAYPDIKPLESNMEPDRAFERALEVAAQLKWTLISSDRSQGHIEAYDTSKLFGFVDDIVIRITPVGSGSRIDVRSVSRVGLSDVGANALRIHRFMDAFTGEG